MNKGHSGLTQKFKLGPRAFLMFFSVLWSYYYITKIRTGPPLKRGKTEGKSYLYQALNFVCK